MRRVFPASLSSKIVLIFGGMLFFFCLLLAAGSLLFNNTINTVFSDYHEKVLIAFNDYYATDIQFNRLDVISSLLDEKVGRLSTVLRDFETNVDVISLIAKQNFDGPVDKNVEIINPVEFATRTTFRKTLKKNPNFAYPVSLVFPDIMINESGLSPKYSTLYWHLKPLFQSISSNFERSLWTYIGFERDGSVINYPGNFSEPSGYDPRKRPWYLKAHKHEGKTVWTSPYFDTGNRSLVLTVAKATYGQDNRRPIFVTASDVVADKLIREMTDIKIDNKFLSVLILDEDQQIIYKSDDKDRLGHWEQMPKYMAARSYFSAEEYEDYLKIEDQHYSPFVFKNSNLFLFKRNMPQTKWTIVFLLDQNYTKEFTDKVNGKFEELAEKSISTMHESKFLSNQILCLMAILVLVFSCCWYLLIKRIVIQPLNRILEIIKNFSTMRIENFRSRATISREDEIAALESELLNLKKSQIVYERTILEKEAVRVKTIVAAQVAHDIRSPLSALNMVTSTLTDIAEQKRDLIFNAIQRINEIASQLLQESNREKKEDSTRTAFVVGLLESIVLEKRTEFKELREVQFITEFERGQGLCANINEVEFSRVISNLINNAVEALSGHGIVKLSVQPLEEDIQILIEDSGVGIPREVLEKLGQRGFSHGKNGSAGGSGLGIHHAIVTMETFGGSIDIQSEVSKGTKVTLTLPKSD
jgi:signal transduction histidine kinase